MTGGVYHKQNPYDELRTVVVGNYYTPDYFDFITLPAVSDPLKRIAEEVNQDLDYFCEFLRSQGCRVIRPGLPDRALFEEYHATTQQFLMPPLQPRDSHTVVGSKLYCMEGYPLVDTFIKNALLEYNSQDYVDLSEKNQKFYDCSMNANRVHYNQSTNTWFSKQKYLELAGPDWPVFSDYVQGHRTALPDIQNELMYFEQALRYETKELHPLQGPNVMPLNDRLIVDANEYCNYVDWAQQHMDCANRTVVQINTKASHTDGCFVILGHGVILGIDPLIDYGQTFPGYRVIPVPLGNYQDHLDNFFVMKQQVDGRWWVPGQEHNQEFINFVELYLKDWTGHVYETVFDVNVLAVNPDTVCVANHNPEIFNQLKQNGIDPVLIPWRHRFFVDCGLHCLTLDLHRGNVL
jgi:hypothetical protein